MDHLRKLGWISLLALALVGGQLWAQAPRSTFSRIPIIEYSDGIFYVELTGKPYVMGTQHGTALAGGIRKSIIQHKENLAAMFGRDNAMRIMDWALHQADFTSDVRKHLPHVWAEMRGIADGAGVPLYDVVLLQMFEEIYEAAPEKLGLPAPEFLGHGCTAFAVRGNGKRLAGQNMEYSGNLLDKQIVLRYKQPDRDILIYGFLGHVGGIGVNSKGVSVFVTTLPQGKKRESGGLGGNYVLRALLETDSVDAALARLKELPRFGALSYTISDFNKSVIVEASADATAVRELTKDRPLLVQTNHILNLFYRKDIPGVFEGGQPVRYSMPLTLVRKEVAEKRLADSRETLDVAAAKFLLTTTPVNMYHPAFMTLQSAIAEYDSRGVRLHVSAGYRPTRKWQAHGFAAPR